MLIRVLTEFIPNGYPVSKWLYSLKKSVTWHIYNIVISIDLFNFIISGAWLNSAGILSFLKFLESFERLVELAQSILFVSAFYIAIRWRQNFIGGDHDVGNVSSYSFVNVILKVLDMIWVRRSVVLNFSVHRENLEIFFCQ